LDSSNGINLEEWAYAIASHGQGRVFSTFPYHQVTCHASARPFGSNGEYRGDHVFLIVLKTVTEASGDPATHRAALPAPAHWAATRSAAASAEIKSTAG
jgi:hypothetical protein